MKYRIYIGGTKPGQKRNRFMTDFTVFQSNFPLDAHANTRCTGNIYEGTFEQTVTAQSLLSPCMSINFDIMSGTEVRTR